MAKTDVGIGIGTRTKLKYLSQKEFMARPERLLGADASPLWGQHHRDLRTTLGYAYFQTQHRREELNSHGGKVLSFVPAQLRIGSRPTVSSTENVLRTDDPPTRHRHYLRRDALHVWTAPVLEVALRLGVSDVALAKLCRRAAIPIPGRGYWARIDSGQLVDRTPLPPAPEGLPELLRIRGKQPIPMAVMSDAA